ncbi:MAG: insulinase family protein [Nitrospinae bacterium]|nr:insulinase family protein [Nitrospinota bacterium]
MDKPPNDGPRCRSRRFSAIWPALILFFAAAGASSTALAFDLKERVKEFTLPNGLKVIVLERSGSPIFAAHITFKVGSVEERTGYSGAAHMLEHMLFKGTTNVGTRDWPSEKPLLEKVNEAGEELDNAVRDGAGEAKIKELREKLKSAEAEHKQYIVSESYSKIYSAEGGVGHNAGTSKDTTNYIIRLPANKLELWARLESDRMKNPVLREYYSERDVVMEELRRSYLNDPQGKLYEKFLDTAYSSHPYGRPIIGREKEIATLPISEVERFLKAWYAPNNAVITIVGDVKFHEVRDVIVTYFASIPRVKLPDRISTVEPAQEKGRRVDVEFDASGEVMMGFHKPVFPHPDDAAFTVIDGLLSAGRTGRFDKNIVRGKKAALSVGTFQAPGDRYPNLFIISGEPRPPKSTADVEKAVWEELELLKKTPVAAKELEKVKNNIEADFIRGLVSHYGMARLLAHYEVVTGDWRNILKELEMIKGVTTTDVQRVAKKYFVRGNLTVGTLVKKK